MIPLRSSSRHSDIVEEAEAGHHVAVGMVTWGSHNGKRLVDQHLRANVRNCFNCAACGQVGRLRRELIHVRVTLGCYHVFFGFQIGCVLLHMLDV